MRPWWVLLLLVPFASADYPQWNGNAQNQGVTEPMESPTDLWWSASLGQRVVAAPVASHDRVVVADASGVVRALHVMTGEELWTASLGPIFSTPAIEGHAVFVADNTGLLRKLSMTDGATLAEAQVGPTQAPLTIHEGKLFVGNEAGELHAFDVSSSALRLDWKFAVTSVYATSTTSGGGESGQPVKTTCSGQHVAGAIRGAPAVHDNRVYVTSLNDRVYALDEGGAPDGTTEVLWTFAAGDAIHAGPVVDTASGRLIVTSDDEMMYAFDLNGGGAFGECKIPQTKSPRWSFDAGSKLRTAPSATHDALFFGAKDGRVVSLSPDGRTRQWEAQVGGAVDGSTLVAGSIVIVPSGAGVTVLNRTDGLTLRHDALTGGVLTGVVATNGLVVAASFEGEIRAWGPPLPKLPNLKATLVSFERQGASVLVQNAGDGAAPGFIVQIRIDGTAKPNIEVPPLNPGATHLIEVPLDLRPGPHSIRVTLDVGGAVTERDEGDNSLERDIELPEELRNVPAPFAAGLLLIVLCARRWRA